VLGVMGALVGWAGLIWRWYPMAIPTQRLWRLSSTITYSDAAGMILAVCLFVSLAGGSRPWLSRLAVCLCAGGAIASQSRGALVGLACALVIIPGRQFVVFAVPIAAGLALGVAAVATSTSTTDVPLLGVALVATTACSLVPVPVARTGGRDRTDRRWPVLIVVAVAAVALLAIGTLLHHEIAIRFASPSDQDRTAEWSAALHQFASGPIYGVGPDRLLEFRAADGTYAHFAHNEYLQVAADIGLIGLALLVYLGTSLFRLVRRVDVLSSCAASALVCWAVAGAFDFDWHLPLIGLLGGWVAGLASGTGGADGESTERSPRWE